MNEIDKINKKENKGEKKEQRIFQLSPSVIQN